jgi:hypothetical protein
MVTFVSGAAVDDEVLEEEHAETVSMRAVTAEATIADRNRFFVKGM